MIGLHYLDPFSRASELHCRAARAASTEWMGSSYGMTPAGTCKPSTLRAPPARARTSAPSLKTCIGAWLARHMQCFAASPQMHSLLQVSQKALALCREAQGESKIDCAKSSQQFCEPAAHLLQGPIHYGHHQSAQPEVHGRQPGLRSIRGSLSYCSSCPRSRHLHGRQHRRSWQLCQ